MRSYVFSIAISIGMLFATSQVLAFELSLDLLEKYSAAQTELDKVSDKFPELEDDFKLENLLQNKGRAIVEELRGANAYDDVNAVAKKHGFDSVTQLVELMSRLTTARMAVEMEAMPPEQRAMMNQSEEEMRKTLSQSGMDQAMIDMQMEFATKMMKTAKMAMEASKQASKEDVAFVRSHRDAIDRAFE